MDILHLIDRLEELFNESRAIPFTHNVIVDEDRMLDLIDQMRVAIPDEVKKAQQVTSQRDRILAQAQEEANRTLALAREKSDQMVERDAIVQSAQARAEQSVAQIRSEAEQSRRDADQYVVDTLTGLELELERIINRSTLEWVGFRGSLEKRVPGPVFRVNVVGEDSDQSFQTMLVGDDLFYLFAEVRKLLLSDVVGHIGITINSLSSNVALSHGWGGSERDRRVWCLLWRSKHNTTAPAVEMSALFDCLIPRLSDNAQCICQACAESRCTWQTNTCLGK